MNFNVVNYDMAYHTPVVCDILSEKMKNKVWHQNLVFSSSFELEYSTTFLYFKKRLS